MMPDSVLRQVLAMLPSDFLIGSANFAQVAKDLFEVQLTGKRLDKGLTVESICTPRPPKARYASIFSQPLSSRWTKPCIRLGFCNSELRPHFEVLLDNDRTTTEVVAPATVSPHTTLHLAGTFDGRNLRLYVDGTVVAEKSVSGILGSPVDDARAAIGSRSASDPGDHYHGSLYCVRVWRVARNQDQIRKYLHVCAPPPHPDPRAPNYGDSRTVYNLAYLSPEPDCELWYPFCLGPYGLAGRPLSDKGEVALATRILAAAGVPERQQDDALERVRSAGEAVLKVCEQLQEIIDDPSTAEPDILAFFKEKPHAAFLLEPDQDGMIWREQQIQGYGQIDFVFRKTSGRYVAMEIESSKILLFREDDEFSKSFDHAIDQVEQWRLGAVKHQDIAERTLGMKGIQSPDGAVVMGRKREITNDRRSERWHERCARSPLSFLTWDDVINRGRSLGRRLGNPELPGADWL